MMKPAKRRLAIRTETIRALTGAELQGLRGANNPAGSDYSSCITSCITQFAYLCTTIPWRTAGTNCQPPLVGEE